MQLGFLTACLSDHSLDEIATWAATHHYTALEVAAWPTTSDRPHTAAHIDVSTLDAAGAQAIGEMFGRHGLTLSSLAYYDNNLHPDPGHRTQVNDHLKRCIDAAVLLGCPTVGTFIGLDPTRSVEDNLREAEKVFAPLVERAQHAGVKIVIENCPMCGWHPDGYPANLAYSPELWEWMFSLGLHLNFDPSHLHWLGIDPIGAVSSYVDHIAHVQAKDVLIDPTMRDRYGVYGKILGKTDPWDAGWWSYRIPGLGEIDWNRLIDVLYTGGYDGVVSVEHEDPFWSGTGQRVKDGLIRAHRELSPYILS
jgi:sugar phosphate isomerase/epimerase